MMLSWLLQIAGEFLDLVLGHAEELVLQEHLCLRDAHFLGKFGKAIETSN